jgi:hypothetical protein
MKQAKQQSEDLSQTNTFLTSLISQEVLEKDRSKPFPIENHASRQANGRPKMPKLDPISRFSEPPAPPPQQPLPEKPDVPPRSSPSDQQPNNSSLKRSDTEKPKLPSGSPVSRESSQILSLVEALSAAKKELEAQGARVKELEDRLRQERSARESAEERARRLEGQSLKHGPDSEIEAAFEPPAEPGETKVLDDTIVETTEEQAPISSPDVATQEPPLSPQPASDNLQQRLDSMMAEMDELKLQVEKYRKSAERAENDSAEARKSLAEMVETLRSERANTGLGARHKFKAVCLDGTGAEGSSPIDGADFMSSAMDSLTQQHRSITPPQIKELESAATAFAKRDRAKMLEQSAPYASMLGVILLGVGIMTYLNGWQKVDK